MQGIDNFAAFVLLSLWNVGLSWNKCKPKDCVDLKCYRVSTGLDGPHTIYPDILTPASLNVSCDQSTPGGGWTVFLKTNDTNLNRTEEECRNGFGLQGGHNTELWLGNENIRLITHNYSGHYGELRIEGYEYNGGSCAMDAQLFRLEPDSDYYRLNYANEIETVQTTHSTLDDHKDTAFSRASNVSFNFCAKFVQFGARTKDRSADYYSHVRVSGCSGRDVSLRRAQMSFRPFVDSHRCDNPCMHGGTCMYEAARDTRHCICPETRCGATCETRCHDDAPTVYDAKIRLIRQTDTNSTNNTNGMATDKTKTKSNSIVFVAAVVGGGLILLAVVIGVMLMLKKKQVEANAEAERQQRAREAAAAEDDEGWFSFLGF